MIPRAQRVNKSRVYERDSIRNRFDLKNLPESFCRVAESFSPPLFSSPFLISLEIKLARSCSRNWTRREKKASHFETISSPIISSIALLWFPIVVRYVVELAKGVGGGEGGGTCGRLHRTQKQLVVTFRETQGAGSQRRRKREPRGE